MDSGNTSESSKAIRPQTRWQREIPYGGVVAQYERSPFILMARCNARDSTLFDFELLVDLNHGNLVALGRWHQPRYAGEAEPDLGPLYDAIARAEQIIAVKRL